MNTYLVKVEFGKDSLYELSKLGEVEYISSVLNVYKLKTEKAKEDIYMINSVEYVTEEGKVILNQNN